MAESPATLTGALEAARLGLTLAQEQARQAGSRRTLPDTGGTPRPVAAAETAAPAQDMVLLSQSLGAAKVCAGAIRIVSGVSEEAVALGRRIDVRY